MGAEQDSWKDCFLYIVFHRSFFHILPSSKNQKFKKYFSTFFLTLSFTTTREENTAVLHLVTQEYMSWLCDVCGTQAAQEECEWVPCGETGINGGKLWELVTLWTWLQAAGPYLILVAAWQVTYTGLSEVWIIQSCTDQLQTPSTDVIARPCSYIERQSK